jgi:UDP-glucose 4-epimerase
MPTDARHVLVVGGAGYIGSHMVLALKEAGYHPVVLDNLSAGHQNAVSEVELVIGDMGDQALLSRLFSTYSFCAVMHFGGCIEVGASIHHPAKYYQTNVAASLNLLDAMRAANIHRIIFSSSAAVYGEPQYVPIDLAHPLQPVNPYGRSKLMLEEIIKDYAKSYQLSYAILRYFNAAGADPSLRAGERHANETHLIPLLLQAAQGQRQAVTVYGRDYPTSDGTCIRDYVHVTDLCHAHLLALQLLIKQPSEFIVNLGTGMGHSVQEVIDAVKKVTRRKVTIQTEQRRAGDPAVLIADITLAKKKLNWVPRYQLDDMINHAWGYMNKHSF